MQKIMIWEGRGDRQRNTVLPGGKGGGQATVEMTRHGSSLNKRERKIETKNKEEE